MKTTIEIHDELLARAKQHAKATGRSLRAVIEDGLRQLLAAPDSRRKYSLPDLSVGDPNTADPLKAFSWQELRGTIYGEPESQQLRSIRTCLFTPIAGNPICMKLRMRFCAVWLKETGAGRFPGLAVMSS